MAATANDQRYASYEQGRRGAYAFLVAKFIESFVEVTYQFGAGATTGEFGEPNDVWQFGLRTGYERPRIMVRIGEPRLYEAARETLRVLGYEIRDKGDHLVVMI